MLGAVAALSAESAQSAGILFYIVKLFLKQNLVVFYLYTVSHKKGANLFFSVTLSKISVF